MYADYFGLREPAFNNKHDPRYYFSTADGEAALASLIYAVGELKGLTVLTGESGTGKTMLTRLMLAHFGGRIAFAELGHTRLTQNNIVSSICVELGISDDTELNADASMQLLQEYLYTQFAEKRPVVLVVDDAHALSVVALEELRYLAAMESQDAALLQILLIGQPELTDTLNRPTLRLLRQRCFRTCQLPPLSESATADYVRHRLKTAGAKNEQMFDAVALRAVYQSARGIPRLINVLCDNLMLTLFAEDRRAIDAEAVREVAAKHLWLQTHADVQALPDLSSPVTLPHELAARLQDLERRVIHRGVSEPAPREDVRRLETAIGDRMSAVERALIAISERRIDTENDRRLERIARQLETLERQVGSFKRTRWEANAPIGSSLQTRDSVQAPPGPNIETESRLDRIRKQLDNARSLVACVTRQNANDPWRPEAFRAPQITRLASAGRENIKRSIAESRREEPRADQRVADLRRRLNSAVTRSPATQNLLRELDDLSRVASQALENTRA